MESKTEKLWRSFEDHLLNQQVTKIRIAKLKTMFAITSKYLNLETANRPIIEDFINRLNRDKIRQKDKRPYSGSSKSDLKKFIKQYYKHTRGNDENYPPEVSWIRTRIAKDEQPKEKEILSQEQAVKLANSFRKPEFKIMTLLLFDSGFRIQEMLSVMKKNITFEPFDDEGNKCFWIKCNVSKTDTRNIPVQLFTEDIRDFLNSSYVQGLKDDDLLFPVRYDYYRQTLKETAKKLFNKVITAHSLRHSSATLYAKLYAGDMIALANRYGWTYSSKELKTYIRKSQAYHRIGAKRVFSDEITKLKEENARLREDFTKLRELVLKSMNKKYQKD